MRNIHLLVVNKLHIWYDKTKQILEGIWQSNGKADVVI